MRARRFPARSRHSPLQFLFRLLPASWVVSLINLSLRRPSSGIKATSRLDPDSLEVIGQRKALLIFKRAAKRTPGYRNFLKTAGLRPADIRSFSDFLGRVPQTTKKNYINIYPLAERCVGGIIPEAGHLEESAGTTAVPTNWVRGPAEDRAYYPLTKSTLAYLYNLKKGQRWVLINGYLLGAWAGSQRFASALGPFGIMKNIGADAPKIVQTIAALGPDHNYLIGGYPPFLKELIDFGQRVPDFDWKRYHVDILTGGEGFVEEWRDYLTSRLAAGARIFSNYGAIDTDAGISTENHFTVAIKRLALKDLALRKALFSSDRMPCFLGQYFPLTFLIIETVRSDGIREFDVTVLNSRLASPRIRYNVEDEGGIITFARLRAILEEKGYDLYEVGRHPEGLPPVPLPFLYILGRSDGTVFFNGATISPSDIQAAILADAELAAGVHNFKITIPEDPDRSVRLAIDLELKEGIHPAEMPASRALEKILASLLESNSCYRRAYERDRETSVPRVRIFPFQSGVFSASQEAPKFRYLDL